MTKYLLEIPDELHKRAKIEAVLSGETLKELILKALVEFLSKKKPNDDE